MKTISRILMTLIVVFTISCSNDDSTIDDQLINNLVAIQGDWHRIGGNNPSNDGMKVNVGDDYSLVVDPQQSGYQIGDVKWKDIVSQNNGVYSYKELGSNSNYYDATMELNVDDTLRISVQSSGAGNIQKWVRQYTIAEVHDCILYEPANFDGNFEADWSEINEVDAFSIMSIPADEYGGGVVNVTVQTNAPVVPCLNLFAGSELATGLATGSNGTSSRTYRFVGHPGSLFSGETTDCENAPSNQYPWNYTVSWTYSGIMDCYEPNDTFEQAKAIPKNQSISAYGVAGYIDGGTGIYEPQTYDWYKVIITQPTKIRATLSQCPGDIHMHFRFFKNNNGNITTIPVTTEEISGEAHDPGSTYYIQTNSVLESGTYFLEAHRLRGAGTPDIVADAEANPEHWSTPYSFTVTEEQ